MNTGICMAATSVSTDHQTEDMNVGCKKRMVPTFPDIKLDNHNPGASLPGTGERSPSPFKDTTNTPFHVHGNENPTCENMREQNLKSAQGWYAMHDCPMRKERNTT